VTSLSSPSAPAAGLKYSCAVRSDGTARCWGKNASGQLGNGNTTSSLAPIAVTNLTTAFAIAACEGGSHTCALRANGVRWGLNASGQLGNGTTTNSTSPVTVNSFAANIDPVVELDANDRVAEVTAFVQCDEGNRVDMNVELTQGGAFGEGSDNFACTGRLESYLVRVPAKGRDEFQPGPADAQMKAEIRDRGVVVDDVQWSRSTTLVESGNNAAEASADAHPGEE
jgi:hypothetical protein